MQRTKRLREDYLSMTDEEVDLLFLVFFITLFLLVLGDNLTSCAGSLGRWSGVDNGGRGGLFVFYFVAPGLRSQLRYTGRLTKSSSSSSS